MNKKFTKKLSLIVAVAMFLVVCLVPPKASAASVSQISSGAVSIGIITKTVSNKAPGSKGFYIKNMGPGTLQYSFSSDGKNYCKTLKLSSGGSATISTSRNTWFKFSSNTACAFILYRLS